MLDDEAFRRKKEQLLSQSPPSSLSPIAEHESDTDAAEEPAPSTSQPTLAAAPHDSKLALFYNVYGPRPTAAAGRGESARAARDALALFHAVYGPPKHLQLLEEEEEAAAAAAAAASAAAAAEELSSLSSRPPSPPRSSLSPLRLQRAASPAASPASSYSSCSPSSSSAPSSSPRATTTIAPSRPSPSSPAPPSARRRLSFSRPLARGVVLERPNRFTMRVRLLETGETVSCHCPVTGALGGLGLGAFEGAGAPCLVSRVADEDDAGVAGEAAGGGGGGGGARKKAKKYYARKTPFTVEAVSLADPRGPPSWVGINQMAANRYFEHFWNAGALPELSSSGSGSGSGSRSPGPGPRPASGANEDGSAAPPPSSRDGGGGGAALVRETRIGDTRSRLDFAASGGRDLVEVKCPLDALPLLRDSSESSFSSSPSSSSPSSPGSSSSTGLRPNPVLASAAALRAQTAGERLARLPRAKRAAMYERAARHASVLAEHLAMAKKRERAAATRARRRATAAAKREAAEAAEGAFSSSPSASSGPSAPSSPLQRALALASLEGDEGEDDEPPLEGEELEPEERGARALLIQCFQFDAPPVRGMLPPPKGADPASDGRAAVAAAMRSAARAGVETWQVNMSFDERGVELLGCFKLDLFSASSSSAAAPGSLKKGRNSRKKTESSSSSSLSVAATASSSSEAAPDPAPASSPSRFESFSSFSSSSSSSSSSSGDESDDGGALVAA